MSDIAMTQVDVIIAGLGPTGATLAGLLGQRGLRVAVFDRLPDLYPLPRAIGLDQEAMRIVQELGLAQRMAAHIAPYRPSVYLGMDGQRIKRLDTLPPPHRLGWAPNYVFDQPAFERVLRQRLSELDTVQVFTDAEIRQTGQAGEQAWADVQLPGEQGLTRFTAAYLIACDGGASPVRKQLGIELEDLDFDEPWLVVDAIVEEHKLAELPQTQVQYCEAERPCTFVVGPGNHRRWEIMLLPGDSLSLEFPEAELWLLLSRWLKPGDARLWRAAAYRFHGLLAREWRRERILLAGDAAHMTPPFMAQGMVGGMRDAHNLAWKLERVIRQTSPATLLDSYIAERSPHVKQTILTAMGLGRIICERDAGRALQRDERLRAEHGGVVKTTYRQNMIPKLEGGLIASGSAGAGELFPQPWVRAGAFAGRLDDLTGARVRVVVLGPLSGDELAAYLAALAPLEGVLVQLGESHGDGSVLHIQEDQPLIAPWLQSLQQCAVVVRPDHCVFGTASTHKGGLDLLRQLSAELS
jgi:3-(3-hydroxy-phenyl)propionate hydroxylase